MRKSEVMKKALSILLTFCMVLSCVSTMAFAVTTDNLCEHHEVHTAEVCGYVEGEADCTYHCEVCHVQELLDALPESVTAENVDAVAAQLAAIDTAKAELSDEEIAQMDFAKYSAAISAINALEDQAGAEVPALVFQLPVTVDGSTITIEAESSDTIEAIKEKIAEQTTLVNPVLTYDGKELEDGRTLADYEITESSTITVTNYYSVTIGEMTGGAVSADKTTAAEGETVTLSVTPADGYEIDTVSYNDGTNDVTVTASEGVYSFTMPAGDVIVSAVFKAKAAEPVETNIIYFDNSVVQWSQVNAYAWDAAGESLLGAWPGTGMTLAEGETSIYFVTVPAGADTIIFNNSSAQTGDQPLGTGNCFKAEETNAEGQYIGSWYTYPCTHADGSYTDNSDGTHTYICTGCGAAQGEVEPHTPDETGKCTGCGYQYPFRTYDSYAEDATPGFYADLDSALIAANGAGQITVLEDYTIEEAVEVTLGNSWLILSEGVILTNNGTLAFGSIDGFYADSGTYEGSGTVMIGESDGIIVDGTLYYYGGDVTSTGLNLYGVTNATYYKAGDGYAIFTPASGDTEAVLELNNASITGPVSVESSSSTSEAIVYGGNLTIRFSGTNTITGGEANAESNGIVVSEVLTLTGTEADSVLNAAGGKLNGTGSNCGINCGSVSVTSGTVNAASGYVEDESWAVSAESVEVCEGATLNAVGGSSQKISGGVYAQSVTVDGTLNAVGGASDMGISAGFIYIDMPISITGSGAANGTVMQIGANEETNTLTIAFSVSGNATLGANLTPWNFLEDMEGAEEVNVTFTVPEGTALTIPAGITLDLTKADNIHIQGELIVNGTLKCSHTIDPETGKCTVCGEVQTFTVTFDANGATFNDSTTQMTVEIEYGTILDLSSYSDMVSRDGYYLDGWYKNDTWYPPNSQIGVTGDITLTAVWAENKYTLYLDPNGGKINIHEQETAAPFATSFSLGTNISDYVNQWSDEFTREGYTFKGFTTVKDDASTRIDTSADYPMPGETLELYALWEINTYNATWIVEGDTYAITQVKYGNPITAPETDPTKAQEGCTAYTFASWQGYTEGMTMPANALTFTAVFTEGEAHAFEIQYDDTNHWYKCSRCFEEEGKATHADVTGSDGKCDTCGIQLAASVTTAEESKIYYINFNDAFTAAKASPNSTLTLLTDVTGSYTVTEGTFTLDLNGKTITGNADNGLYVPKGSTLTITDSSEAETGTVVGKTYGVENYGTLTVTGGTISGGSAGVNNYYRLTVSGSAKLKSTDESGVSIRTDGGVDLRDADCNGWTIKNNSSGSVTGENYLIPDGYVLYVVDELTGVEKMLETLGSNDVCTIRDHTHEDDATDGDHECDICGVLANTHSYNEGRTCTECGAMSGVLVTYADGHTDYRDSVNEALADDSDEEGADDNVVSVQLLSGVTVSDMEEMIMIQSAVILDLNGHSVIGDEAYDEEIVIYMAYGDLTLKDSSEAQTGAVSPLIYHFAGDLTIEGAPNISVLACGNEEDEPLSLDLTNATFDRLDIWAVANLDEALITGSYGLFDTEGNRVESLTGIGSIRKLHTHSWIYSAFSDSITATCKGTVGECDVKTATIKVAAPTGSLVYDGQVKTATTTGSIDGVDTPVIIYTGDCKSVGTHYASIKLGDAEATVSFEITPATPTIAWSDTTASVDHTGKAAVITAPAVTLVNGETFSGTINYSYTGASSGTGLPTNGGTYTITASIAAQGNYTAATSTNTLTLTIEKKQLDVSHMTWNVPENAVYNNTEYTAILLGNLPEGVKVTVSGNTGINAGSYTATAKFSLADGYSADNYEIVNGEDLTTGWSIAKKDIADATITLGAGLTYNGGEQTQTVTSVEIDGLTVTYGISGNTGTNAGDYELTVTGSGNFEGTATKEWNIAKKNITGATITLGDSLTYNGGEQTQAVAEVKIDGLTVTYDVSGNTGANAGDYELTITGNGNFEGTATADWSIAKKDITGAEISLGTGLTYNGQEQTQTVTGVAIDGLTVTYDVSGNTGAHAGSYTLTITGNGNFTGTTTTTFTIDKALLTADDFSLRGPANRVYTGTGKTAVVTGPDGVGEITVHYTNEDGNTSTTAPVNVGEYYVGITVTESTNYKAVTEHLSTPDWLFKIEPYTITEDDVKLNSSLSYTGSEQTQAITVTEGVTYEVTGNKATDVGTYELIVKGTGNYTGEVKLNWSIKETAAVVGTVPTAKDLTYTGSAQALVTEGTTADGTMMYKLGENGTYSTTIPSAENADTYTVYYYVKGDSNHNDSAEQKIDVTIGQFDITGKTVDITLADTLTYNGAEQTMGVSSVKLGDLTVTYTVSGNTGTNATDYTLTITGSGNFKGTATKTWSIAKKSVTVSAKDQTITYGETISGTEVTSTGLGDGHSVTVTLTPSTANVTVNSTITPSAAVITADGSDVTANYSVSYASGKLVIEPDTSKIDDLTTENVTSANEEDIKAVQAMMASAETGGIDEATAAEWAAITANCEALIDVIEAVRNATDTENTKKVEDVTAENVKPEDKEALEDAKADLEKALEDNSGNYTEEEKQAIQDEIQRIEDAIEALENVEDVTETITQLPESVEPDDEEASTSPTTGDASNIMLWSGILCVSTLGLVVLLADRKRRRSTK